MKNNTSVNENSSNIVVTFNGVEVMSHVEFLVCCDFAIKLSMSSNVPHVIEVVKDGKNTLKISR